MEFNDNFQLIKVQEIDEIKAKIYLLEHKKTKGKVLFTNNLDINKSFIISFNTPCDNSKGIPHILEHSVLNGSKNYNLKDAFINLVKQSNANFLNAFTFPDKTGYIIASRSAKEIANLQSVYLDAVFYPNVVDDKRIFLQEGWRYEFDENDKLKYSGVVYGEMKGATSSPEEQISKIVKENLFKGTHYENYSGGFPKDIVKLEYDELVEFHKKYYHPTNSYTYYYGNFTEDEINLQLDVLNNYLKDFDEKKVDVETKIDDKNLSESISLEREYITSDEDIKDKTFIVKSFLGPSVENIEDLLGFSIVVDSLFNLNSSMLKKEILSNNLCHDFDASYSFDDFYKSYFTLILHNSDKSKKDVFEKIYSDVLNKIKKDGIDKNLLRSALNKTEFYFREMPEQNQYTYGMLFYVFVANTYQRGLDNFNFVEYNKVFESLRKKIEDDNSSYFEDLLSKYFLENGEFNLVYFPKFSDEDEELKRLEEVEKSLNSQSIENIKKENDYLKTYQNNQDSLDEINKIKTISLDEIDKVPAKDEVVDITNKQKTSKFDKIIYYKNDTKGISYVNFYFNNFIINQEDVFYLGVLEDVLDEVKTKNYDYDEFSNLIDIYTGGIGFSNLCYEDMKKELHFKMQVSCKTLNRNFSKGVEILSEYFNNVIFEEDKVLEVLKRVFNSMQMSFVGNGYNLVFSRLKSYFSKSGVVNDKLEGLDYYDFLKDLIDNFDNKKDVLLNKINEIYDKIFNSHNLIVALNCEDEVVDENLKALLSLNVKNYVVKNNEYKFDLVNKSEGVYSQNLVNYVGLGFNLSDFNFEYTGKLLALKHFLRYGFLWDEIRARGGAYGIMIEVNKSGSFMISSYRDPNLENTYNVYGKIPKFLQNVKLDERELKNLIIGTLTKFDTYFNAQVQGNVVFSDYLRGINYDMRVKEREDILNLTNDDLVLLGDVLENGFSHKNCFTFGTKNLVEKYKGFKVIRRL